MISDLRRVRVKLQNLIVRAVVDLSGVVYQVRHMGSRVASTIQHLQPQGVHFRVPAGAQGVLLSPAGETAAAVLVNAQGAVPSDVLASGEGGLHYLGSYKVFLDDAGLVHLGDGTSADEFVVLADKLQTAISTMLAAGIGATGTDAFAAAKVAWDAVDSSTYSATKVKAT